MATLVESTPSFVPPQIVDFGSIAAHTFGGGSVFHGLSAGSFHCNSGRGNGPEGNPSSTTFVDPHNGGRGPGPYPTDDCDPGNSGAKNRGGD